jgi:hypothetical protein
VSDINARWQAAIHEAGHAVAAAREGLRPKFALVSDSGMGRTVHDAAVDPFANALIAAAGPAAEALAETYEPPRLRYATATSKRAACIEPMVAAVEAVEHDRPPMLDWQVVATHATSIPDHRQWTARAERVHGLAARLIHLNHWAVLLVARRLYRRGMLTSRDFERLLPPAAAETGTKRLRVAAVEP